MLTLDSLPARELSMSERPAQSTLNLLSPWELPLELSLSPQEQKLVESALREAIWLLQQPISSTSLQQIETIIIQLGEVQVQSTDLPETKTSLKPWEVEDYDRYFGTHHVQTKMPGLCLVQGTLLVIRSFIELQYDSPQLNPAQIEIQRQGFWSYIQLLKRVFGLN